VLRRAVSGTVIAVVVVVVVVVVGAGLYFGLGLGGGGTSQTSTTGSVTPPSGSLQSAVNGFITAFDNRDVTTIKTYFTGSSQIDWSGAAGGLQGTYTGVDGAGIVYGTSVGHTTSLTATSSNLQYSSTTSPTATVTYGLNISGVSQIVGSFNSTVDVSQNWVYQGGSWSIAQDNWNYLTFSSSTVGGATVFPQWGLTLSGKAPSLASEHVVEWNVAPYLAAGVYATIVALGIALIWVRIRKQRQ
jgi:hypothetical protein